MKRILIPLFWAFPMIALSYGYTDTLKTDTAGFVKSLNKATTWLTGKGFALRKTLDGSKDEQKPATIMLNNDYENNFRYFTIDLGVKILEKTPVNQDHILWTLFPKVEWHKDGIPKDDKKKNNVTAGLNSELVMTFADPWITRPVITSSYDYKDDLIKKIKTTQLKGFITFTGTKNFAPGASTRTKGHVLIFRYYPYLGFERYQDVQNNTSASLFVKRIFAEFYPVSTLTHQHLQLTVDYAERTVMSDDLFKQGDMHWLSLGLNIYPDGKGKIGIGLDYSKGEDPSSNFVKTDRLALGLKLKL